MAVTVPRTVFEFTIDSDGTFPDRAVGFEGFSKEIRDRLPDAVLVSVGEVDGNCRIVFGADITHEEELQLEAAVLAHHPDTFDFTTPYLKAFEQASVSTASTSFQTRVVLSTGNLAGAFNIFWSCQGTSSNGAVGEYRVVDENGTVIGETMLNDRQIPASISESVDIALDGTPKTFLLQWRSSGSGAHSIKSARIELWRA